MTSMHPLGGVTGGNPASFGGTERRGSGYHAVQQKPPVILNAEGRSLPCRIPATVLSFRLRRVIWKSAGQSSSETEKPWFCAAT